MPREDPSEAQTREELIDKQLRNSKWLEKYIKREVNPIKTEFKKRVYSVLRECEIEKGVDEFIDYALLSDDYSPLAIIEAKRYSADKEKGRIQARTYSKDVEKKSRLQNTHIPDERPQLGFH